MTGPCSERQTPVAAAERLLWTVSKWRRWALTWFACTLVAQVALSAALWVWIVGAVSPRWAAPGDLLALAVVLSNVALVSAYQGRRWYAVYRKPLGLWASLEVSDAHREGLHTAVELALRGRGSSALVTRVIVDMWAVVRRITDPGRRHRRRALMWCLGAVLAQVLCGATYQKSAQASRTGGSGSSHSLVGAVVSDLRQRVEAPPYAQSGRVEGPFRSSTVELLTGSVLTLTGRALYPSHQLYLELHQTPPVKGTSRRALSLQGDAFKVSLSPSSTLAYRFVATSATGQERRERGWRRLRIREDQSPTVELRRPRQSMEVRPAQEVLLEGDVADDVGLARIEVVVSAPGSPLKRRTVAFQRGAREVSVRHLLSVSKLGLRPGERVEVWLEAVDVHAPESSGRLGRSRRLSLQMFSVEGLHMKLLSSMVQLGAVWTHRLADRLEQPAYTADLPQQVTRVLAGQLHREHRAVQATLDLLRSLREDEITAPRGPLEMQQMVDDLQRELPAQRRTLRGLRADMGGFRWALARSKLGKAHGRTVDVMERGLERWVGAYRREYGRVIERQTERVKLLRAQLRATLDKLKGSPADLGLRAEAERSLAELRRRLRRIEEAAAGRARLVPADAINERSSSLRRARRKLAGQGSSIDALRRAVTRGDPNAALASMNTLEQSIDDALKGVHERLQRERVQQDQTTRRWAARLSAQIRRIQASQRELSDQVAPLSESQARAEVEAFSDVMARQGPAMRRVLSGLRSQLRSGRLRSRVGQSSVEMARARSALSDGDQALKRGRSREALRALADARHDLDMAQRSLSGHERPQGDASHQERDRDRIAKATRGLDGLLRKLRTVSRAPRDLHDERAAAELTQRARAQEKMARALKPALDRSQRGVKRAPGIAKSVSERLKHAQSLFREAATSLRQADAVRALRHMREGAQALGKAQGLLRHTQRNQRRAQSSSARHSGVSPGARSDGKDQGEARAVSVRGGNVNESGHSFHRAVMRAMRRRAPSGYERQVRDYLQGLASQR